MINYWPLIGILLVVIGFALTIVLAAIVLRAWRATRSLDARDIDMPDQQAWPHEERSVE